MDANYQRFLKDHYRDLLDSVKSKAQAAAATGVGGAPFTLSPAEEDAMMVQWLSELELDDPRRRRNPTGCRFARWVAAR